MMASVNPCAAAYQCCHSEVPMVRLRSKGIDNSSLKFQFWDNSFLYMKNGHPVGVIIATDTEIEWLSTLSEEEKAIIELASSIDCKDWSTLMIHNPGCYLNHELYFVFTLTMIISFRI